jgi:hypothetical protein
MVLLFCGWPWREAARPNPKVLEKEPIERLVLFFIVILEPKAPGGQHLVL